MVKKENTQRSIVISKELSDKIKIEVEKDCSSFSAVVKKILTEYFKNK